VAQVTVPLSSDSIHLTSWLLSGRENDRILSGDEFAGEVYSAKKKCCD